ncbi:MFS transporter, UMF1 family [Poseidonocella pacifica]|uniref:MFS transporter, UMF1 family n=1 Tax=Poseidonocella pacifica TaxID=871651 RepID=A0A1I0XBA1_9RHOB|nr:MFS transporter [Poseidonocella pacifica]SFA98251.1 MFS transporter, UMF1 family [Poseidonocella pacifica]
MTTLRKRIWGWYFFDWASQPYNTLLLTFVFAPYIKDLIGDGAEAQSVWGFGIGLAGLVIALTAPILGALADVSGHRMRWIKVFSVFYIIGAGGLWWAAPDSYNLLQIMIFFAIGLIGMEFATIFTNSMLPDLGPKEAIGRISGNGWAFGYLGGLFALVLMLFFFAESAETGRTLIGFDPAVLGFDTAAREGTRSVGPFVAIWFAVFMIPFFAFVRDPKPPKAPRGATLIALKRLRDTIRTIPRQRSLFAFLGSSMLYRDALNGIYAFGGIYAAGVLDWSVVNVGIFGLIAIIAGAGFAWAGGMLDARLGPKPVLILSITALTIATICTVFITRHSVLGMAVPAGSPLPDYAFYLIGAVVGGAGGVLQSSSRSMMVYQADPERMTEAFGLYALSGKATSFIAPLSIGALTALSGSQQIGVTPLILLFLLGLYLLRWVKAEGDTPEWQANPSSAPH